MRTLSATLEAAQQEGFVNALVKLVLTYGATTYTYTKSRIVDIKETGNTSLQWLEVLLDNTDGELTALDLRGYKGVLSYGAKTSAGEEYSALAPMWVTAQEFNSTPDKKDCVLSLVGICNLMADDKASQTYQPDEDDTKTVKTLIGEIIGATLACFNHCTAYGVVWDSEDTLIDTYKPKDAFRVYVGNNRLSAVNRLLEYTKCAMRAEDDGKIHIFQPTTTGTTYDYEYALETGHPFFAKALRNRLTIPNYIRVESRSTDTPQYGGTAQEAESYDRLPKREYKLTRLESNAQATAVAEAILAKAQLWCEAGSAIVPLNVGQEVYDYVKVTDEEEGDYRVGNIGKIVRHVNLRKNEWRMTFVFGNWQTVRKALSDLGITGDDIENYFSRLSVGSLYAEHILVEQLDAVWIDPEGNIDLSQIGDTLDNLPDGEVYARIKSLHLDAGQLKLDEYTLYSPGYNPTTKFDLGSDTLDDVPNGTVYKRVKTAALSADGLVLLDQVTVGTYGLVKSTDITQGHIELTSCLGDLGDIAGDLDDIANGATYGRIRLTATDGGGYIELNSLTKKDGEWYDNSGVAIDSTKGICIYGTTGQRLITSATKWGTAQCYVGTDGCIYAGAGAVKLSSTGIQITGQELEFIYGGVAKGWLFATSIGMALQTGAGSLVLDLAATGAITMGGSNITLSSSYLYLNALQYMLLPAYDDSGGHPTGVLGKIYRSTANGEIHVYTNGGAGTRWYHLDLIAE